MKKEILILLLIFLVTKNTGHAKTFQDICKQHLKETVVIETIQDYTHQTTVYVSLRDCLNIGLINNYGIKIAQDKFEAAKYNYKSLLAMYLPDIGLTSYGNLLKGEYLIGSALLREINEIAVLGGVYIKHDLLNGGKTIFNSKAGKFLMTSERKNLNFTNEEIVMKIAMSYYELLDTKLKLEIYIKNHSERKAQLKLTENLFEAGLGTRFDVIRAQNELANAEQQILNMIAQFKIKQANLTYIMGIDFTTSLCPKETEIKMYKLIDENITTGELAMSAIKERQDVKSLEEKIKSLEYEKKSLYSEYIPKADITAQYSSQGTINIGFGQNLQVIANLNIPIGKNLGINTLNKIKAKEAEIKMYEHQLQEKKRDIEKNIISSYYKSKVSKDRAEIAEKQIGYATESVNLAELRLDTGEGILLDVIQAQTLKTQARIEYLDMVINYNINQVELLYSAGLISKMAILREYEN
ncbi:TolC family protein [bacterium]|nr:TolC family protein [bacterium]